MAANKVTLLVYLREDDRWAWHLKVGGNIIATDGGQGYENEADCWKIADAVAQGKYAAAERKIRKDRKSDGT